MAISSRRRVAADAWGAVLRTQAALVPVLDRTLRAETGLALGWYDVLLELRSAGGRLTMSELGARVVLSRSRVSRVVDELVSAGLVRREANADDGRSAFAVLTPRGRQRYERAATVYLAAIEQHFAAGLSVEQLRTVARLLDSVLERQNLDSR